MRKVKPRKKVLRDFGLVMAGAFTIFGSLSLYKGKPWWPYVFAVAVAFLVLAFVAPVVLSPLEKIWMKFGDLMSKIVTPLVVAIIFFVVMTPLALLAKLFRKDFLALKIEPDKDTYWVPVEKDGPGSRHFLPY